MDGSVETLASTKSVDKLNGCAEFGEGRDTQYLGVIKVEYAFVGVFGKQRVEHGAGPVAIFVEYISFLDVLGALAPGQRLGVKSNMTDQIKSIKVLTQFCGDNIKVQTLSLQLLDNRLLAAGTLPTP